MSPETFVQQDLEFATDQGHESEKLYGGWVLFFGLLTFVAVIAALIIVALVFSLSALNVDSTSADESWSRKGDGPGVQANQAYDLAQLEHALEQRLHSYGWEDQQQGVAHIPIERAMAIVAKNHVRIDWPSQKDGSAAEPFELFPSDSASESAVKSAGNAGGQAE